MCDHSRLKNIYLYCTSKRAKAYFILRGQKVHTSPMNASKIQPISSHSSFYLHHHSPSPLDQYPQLPPLETILIPEPFPQLKLFVVASTHIVPYTPLRFRPPPDPPSSPPSSTSIGTRSAHFVHYETPPITFKFNSNQVLRSPRTSPKERHQV